MRSWHKTTRTAAQAGFAGHVNKEQGYEQAEKVYYECLQHFGEANHDNTATFSPITATNVQIANNTAAAVETLQKQM